MAQYFWTAEDYDVGDDASDAWGEPIAVSKREIEEGVNGKYLDFRGPHNTHTFLSFLPPGVEAPRDVELWVKYVATNSNQDAAPAFARGVGLGASGRNMVRSDWRARNGRISRLLNGTFNNLAQTPVFHEGILGCARASFIGENFKSKWWAEASGEQSVWDLELQNSDFDHGGRVGIFIWSSHPLQVYAFGVGTEGDPAPSEALSPSPQTPINLSAEQITTIQALLKWESGQ